MRSKTIFLLSIATALILTVAVSTIATVPVQVGADGEVEEVRSYDPSKLELPEGIAVDKVGNIYVGLGPPLGPFGQIRKISPDGTETVLIDFEGPAPAGLAVDAPGNVYYAYFTLDPDTRGVYRLTGDGATERLPGTGDIILPNAVAFDKQGNLYVSDSILGAIWRIPRGGSAELWLQHISLEGCGLIPDFPPIGANGVAYWHGDLYVANTEKGLIVRIPILTDGAAGDPEIIAGEPGCIPENPAEYGGLDGPDGIALDVHGNIYAVLVLQDKLVRIDPVDGEYTVLLTADDDLDEPASIAFGTGKGDRQSVFFTNFAIVAADDGAGPTVMKFDVGVPGLPLP